MLNKIETQTIKELLEKKIDELDIKIHYCETHITFTENITVEEWKEEQEKLKDEKNFLVNIISKLWV